MIPGLGSRSFELESKLPQAESVTRLLALGHDERGRVERFLGFSPNARGISVEETNGAFRIDVHGSWLLDAGEEPQLTVRVRQGSSGTIATITVRRRPWLIFRWIGTVAFLVFVGLQRDWLLASLLAVVIGAFEIARTMAHLGSLNVALRLIRERLELPPEPL